MINCFELVYLTKVVKEDFFVMLFMVQKAFLLRKLFYEGHSTQSLSDEQSTQKSVNLLTIIRGCNIQM